MTWAPFLENSGHLGDDFRIMFNGFSMVFVRFRETVNEKLKQS